ncbi:tetratricopeptide repeat protein [candidate division KSB1 bacterium]|nr:tetratricopeptide repeat protein [candidate division KSB1 bacterium]
MKKKFLIFIFLLTILSLNCAYYNTFFNVKKFFNDAEKERLKTDDQVVSSQAKQNYTKAIQKASRLLEFYPESKYVDDALFILGKSFYYTEEYRKAKRKFEELIENFPDSKLVIDSQLWMGKTNIELRDYETAEKNFRKILSSKTDKSILEEAQFLLGGLYFHKEDYIVALSEYEIAAKMTRDKSLRSRTYYQIGECYFNLKNYSAAADAFESARRYSTDVKSEYNALYKAGITHKEMKEYDTAISVFMNLLGDIAFEDKWPECKLQVAECLEHKGEINNAISWYESITEEHPRTDEAARSYYHLGVIYEHDRFDYEKAKEYLEKAAKEYSRSEIVPLANAKNKSIQNLLALKEDIKKQEQAIARGDSVAAAMDSIAVDIDTENLTENLDEDSLRRALPDSSMMTNRDFVQNPESRLPRGESEDDEDDPRMPGNPASDNQGSQKLLLKSGKLGTPQEELIKDKLMLAEIYVFDFEQPDSALVEYRDIIEKDTTVENITKAAFSIGYIFEKFKADTVTADSIYRDLIQKYPKSTYADQARLRLNIPTISDQATNVVKDKFEKAERYYLTYNNYDEAIKQFAQIVTDYPLSEYAAKSLYSIGWIYSNELNENDKAIEVYGQLAKEYQESDYAKQVKPKLDIVEKFKSGELSLTDSTTLAANNKAEEEMRKRDEGDKVKAEIKDRKRQDRELLKTEMNKFNPRLQNPKRIIKGVQ